MELGKEVSAFQASHLQTGDKQILSGCLGRLFLFAPHREGKYGSAQVQLGKPVSLFGLLTGTDEWYLQECGRLQQLYHQKILPGMHGMVV